LAENCLRAETLSPIVSGDSRRHFRRIEPIFARIVECLADAAYRAAELGNVWPMRGIGRPNLGMSARCEVSGGRTRECSPDAAYRAAELGNVRPMRRIGRPNSGMFARCGISGGRTQECSPVAAHRTAELGNVRPMRRIGRSNSGIGIYQTEFGLRKRATYI